MGDTIRRLTATGYSTSAVGRDTISHPDRGHDDVANATAALSKFGGYDTSMSRVSGNDNSGWQRVRLQAFKTAEGASDYDGVLRALSR
jgi:hypothetical protein